MPTKSKETGKSNAFLDDAQAQKHAKEAVEEFVCWHICGVGMRPSVAQVPEAGTATAIRWKQRTFLLTADHV